MNRPANALASGCLVLLCALPRAGFAEDWVVLNPLQLELIANYDGRLYETSGVKDFYSIFQGGIGLTQEGYSVDPGFFRFSVRLEPLYSRVTRERDDERASADDVLTNYDLGLHFLEATTLPVRMDVRLFKRSTFSSLTLGSTSLSVVKQNEAVLHWKNEAFPSRLTYTDRDFRQSFRSGLTDQRSRRDERARAVRFEGRSSRMWLFAEALDQDDRIEGRDRDFERTRTDWRHRLSWGRNSNLTSEAHYLDRTGFNAYEQLRWQERAQIRHGDHFTSNTGVNYTRTERTTDSRSFGGDFDLTHTLYQNLRTSFSARGASVKSDTFNQDDWRSGLQSRYRKNNLLGVNVGLGLGGYLGNVDRESKQGVIEVVDESHVVPLSGEVLLNRRFVILESVVVTDSTGGLVYDEGFDYELFSLSEGFTQLRTIPGGRIQTGERILVSYLAQALPSSEYDFREWAADFNLAWKGFTLSYTDRKRNNTLVSGSDTGFLQDFRHTTIRAGFRHLFTRGDISLSFERRDSETGSFRYLAHTFDQSLTYSLTPRARLSLRLLESQVEQDEGGYDLYQAQLSLMWHPARGLSVQPTLSGWKREVEDVPGQPGSGRDEQYVTAGIRVLWTFRKIWLDFSLYHNEREVDQSDSVDDRVMLRLTRRIL